MPKTSLKTRNTSSNKRGRSASRRQSKISRLLNLRSTRAKALLFALVFGVIGLIALKFSLAENNPTGRFYIVGKDIVAPDGSKFYPVGANVGINGQIGFNYNDSATNHAADAEAWGWNTVRLTIYCSTKTSWIGRYGYDNLMRDTKAFIDAYTAKKIVVMVECHDLTGKGGDTSYYPDYDRFWTEIVTSYKDNTYVWFNPVNEPFWSNNEGWITLHKRFYDLIRNLGAENIIVADALNMGNDSGWDGAKRLYDDAIGPALVNGRCNVLLSLHAYGGMGGDAAHSAYIDAVHAKGLSLVIGEFGYTTDGSSTAGTYAQNVQGTNATFNVAPGKGVGVLWWHGTHNDKYSLKGNNGPFWGGGNSVGLSAPGQKLWNLSHNKPNLGTFTGSYRDSNCPSALVSNPDPDPDPNPDPDPETPAPGVTSGSHNDSSFSYSSGWSTSTGSGKYQNDDHYSATTDATATLQFSGTQLQYYASKASHHGIIAISIDGGQETMVDLYSSSRQDQALVYSSPVLGAGTHTLTVRITGTKNTSAGGRVGTVDRIDVSNSLNDTAFDYQGKWRTSTGDGKYLKDDHYSSSKGATATVQFTGSQVKYYASKASHHGIVAVSIDGGAEVMVDLYSRSRQDQELVFTSQTLSEGTHTLKIRVTGNKNRAAKGTVVTVDRLDVF